MAELFPPFLIFTLLEIHYFMKFIVLLKPKIKINYTLSAIPFVFLLPN